MYESSGSKMDSKFSLIFDSGVDVFDSVSPHIICKYIEAEKAIEKQGVHEKADACSIGYD